MRKLILAVLALTALMIPTLMYVHADDPEFYEFYFTRLAYTENGSRGWGWAEPEGFVCPEFGGRSFFPQQSLGWGMDYPGADCKFMGGVQRLTNLSVNPNPNVTDIMDDDLFNFPYAYIVEPGGMDLTQPEAERLREYLNRGGFLHVDDFWGFNERMNFEFQMRKVFPDRRLEPIPLSHEIFHTFFDIDDILQIPGQGNGCYGGPTWESSDERDPRIYGMTDDRDRLMVVVTYNSDLGDAWEYMDLPCYPEIHSGQAYRLGMNFMIYAMTH